MPPPAGLTYLPAFLAEREAGELWELFEGWSFEEIRLHDRPARRTARHFGTSYDFQRRSLGPAEDLPAPLRPVRARAAGAVDVPPERFEEALVLRYPAGAGIGWHRDAPHFGTPLLGISIGAACVLRFKRRRGEAVERHAVTLEPGSAYVLDGAARWSWQHSIAATPGLRYSITFRTVRSKPKPD